MKLPEGFRYAATYAGIRKERKNDLALIVSDIPASAAAVFTTNQVQAAPVRLGRKHLAASGGKLRAVLVNAGNANCATRTGDKTAETCARALAKQLEVPVEQVIPSSTGVIGVELDPELVTRKIPELLENLSPAGLPEVAAAIMTTDTVPKMTSAEIALQRGVVRIAGVTKGSGMIHPNMATTLAFLATDAVIDPVPLRQALVPAVENSFHRLSVDGDTSTNDTVLVMANGGSGVKPLVKEWKLFQEVLGKVLEDLARKIARDGEGARKQITIDVVGASNNALAVQIARSIANSPLVKTAVAGSDPNWGRILVAAGYAGVGFDPSKVDIYLQGVKVCEGGLAAEFSEPAVARKMAKPDCKIEFVIRGRGRGQARFWTCDLTEDYIRINAEYRT